MSPSFESGLNFEKTQEFHDWIAHDLLLSQRLFTYSPAYDTAIISGVGSGKTAAFVLKAVLLSMMNPNNMGLIGRDTETNLIESTQKDFFEICPKELLLPGTRKGRNGKAVIKTIGGHPSTIIFRYFRQSNVSSKHLSGLNLGFYACDQKEDITQTEWDYPHTRLRRANIETHRRFGILNPKGHDWNWRRYIEPAEIAACGDRPDAMQKHFVTGYAGKQAQITEYWPTEEHDRHAIVTWTHENRFLPPGYIESIEKNQTREYIERYLYSSFDEWGGKIYKEFYSGSPHVIQPYNIPDDWETVVSIDVGGDSPWAILTMRFDPLFGDCFITNEFFKPGVLIDEIIDYISNRERSGIPKPWDVMTRYIVDPENKPVIHELHNRGVLSEAARKGPKVPGIMRVAGYMQPKTGRKRTIPNQRMPGGGIGDIVVENAPHLWVFERCENFIREHTDWMWERDARTNLSTNRAVDAADHTCDALIYGLRIRPDVKELPKVDPLLERLRRAHFGSYRLAQMEIEENDPAKKTRYSSELFADVAGESPSEAHYNKAEWRKFL